MKFTDYHEARVIVDALAEIATLQSLNEERTVDRFGGAVGEFGKSVAGGLGSTLASPFKGLWRAGKRAVMGRDGLTTSDARNEMHSEKEKLMRALMSLEPEERDQEIEKFKVLLNSFKGRAKDDWARLSGMSKWMGGFQGGTDYKKFA